LDITVDQFIVEKLKVSNDQNEFKKCKRILEKAYENWIKHCRPKSLDPKVGILAKIATDISGYFSQEMYI
jgi:hypothetical protein